MEQVDPHCRFCIRLLTFTGKRVNLVPVFAVSKNKELLVVPGQESIILAPVLENLGFGVVQKVAFSDLSCMQCARQVVRLSHSFSILISRCNEPALKVNVTSFPGVSLDSG